MNIKKDIEKKIATSEYKSCTLNGVKNLSRSDLETALLYVEYAESDRLNELMPPRGYVELLLKAYHII